MGLGPLYSFFVAYHLVHFEAPNAIAGVLQFRDKTIKPLGGPAVEIYAVRARS
jgi:predicted homoserine dehydrogenase-like protein